MTVRRIKAYTGQTGYVYQYYFVGKRPGTERRSRSALHRIRLRCDRGPQDHFRGQHLPAPQALEAWAASRGRSLSEPEQYAGVKLRLMQAFDEIPDMLNHGRRLRLDAEMLLVLLDSIGVE